MKLYNGKGLKVVVFLVCMVLMPMMLVLIMTGGRYTLVGLLVKAVQLGFYEIAISVSIAYLVSIVCLGLAVVGSLKYLSNVKSK